MVAIGLGLEAGDVRIRRIDQLEHPFAGRCDPDDIEAVQGQELREGGAEEAVIVDNDNPDGVRTLSIPGRSTVGCATYAPVSSRKERLIFQRSSCRGLHVLDASLWIVKQWSLWRTRKGYVKTTPVSQVFLCVDS